MLLQEKVEATAQVVFLIAQTVWERPDVVVCKPRVRVGFLAMLLLASIGGFRPKALLKFRYSQITLAVVRDPKRDSVRTNLVATIRTPVVKRRTGSGQKWYVSSQVSAGAR